MTEPKTAHIAFEGELGPMYRLFLVNLLLTLLTLGVYSFWAKTRVRRYLLSHTALMGDRFEYTGTGGELFRSFLLAVSCIFLPAIVIITTLERTAGPTAAVAAQMFFFLILLILLPVAQFTGTRYRLSRTQWRGVRFGLDGSPWAFAGKTMIARLVMIATLGLMAPQAVLAQERYRLDRVQFGDLVGRLNARWREAPWLSWFPLVLVVYLLIALVAYLLIKLVPGVTALAFPGLRVQFSLWHYFLTIFFLIFVFGAPSILFVWHQARFIRFLCTRWGLRGDRADAWVALYPPQKPGSYVALLIGNYLLVFFTLGLATPIVWRRTMRFLERVILVNGDGLEDAAQNELAKPTRGEGLLGALDAGVV